MRLQGVGAGCRRHIHERLFKGFGLIDLSGVYYHCKDAVLAETIEVGKRLPSSVISFEYSPFTQTYIDLSARYDANQLSACPDIPCVSRRRSRRISWFTVSKQTIQLCKELIEYPDESCLCAFDCFIGWLHNLASYFRFHVLCDLCTHGFLDKFTCITQIRYRTDLFSVSI